MTCVTSPASTCRLACFQLKVQRRPSIAQPIQVSTNDLLFSFRYYFITSSSCSLHFATATMDGVRERSPSRLTEDYYREPQTATNASPSWSGQRCKRPTPYFFERSVECLISSGRLGLRLRSVGKFVLSILDNLSTHLCHTAHPKQVRYRIT